MAFDCCCCLPTFLLQTTSQERAATESAAQLSRLEERLRLAACTREARLARRAAKAAGKVGGALSIQGRGLVRCNLDNVDRKVQVVDTSVPVCNAARCSFARASQCLRPCVLRMHRR